MCGQKRGLGGHGPSCWARMLRAAQRKGLGSALPWALRSAPEALNLAGLLGPDLPLDVEG